ncbi:LCP family protein [Oscillatoria sp. FACHB-1407]|uniref:LCP family protein n=1 Tax=Oscillatoria sp. FACHB-1407 TaxID=2692847 RepID=UPI001685E32D|nr:LCP family protein [Oscillatoria sp. FACHB-1407]MBD2462179.1 LCP family protein [Oscillatoria sp. FACHB-1407]
MPSRLSSGEDAAQPTPVSLSVTQPTWSKRLLWSVTFLLAAGVSASIGAMLTMMTPLPPSIAPQGEEQVSLGDVWQRGFGYRISRPINVLVMGIDRVPNVPDGSPEVFSGRSDTMLLVRIDPVTESVNVLSIPRDTRVSIPEEGTNKINHANTVGGAELAARTVSANFDGVTIDRYVRVSTGAFRELVDLVGGVRIFVPQEMYYVDNTQGLFIDLQPGWQVLNGEQAEGFARFRRDATGDVGRVQRQQQLIRALRDRLMDPTVLPKLPEALRLVQQSIDTNLSLDEMLALISFGLGLEQDNFRMVMLPGRFSTPSEYVASYWIMDEEKRDQIMQQYFQVDSLDIAAEPRDLNSLRIAVQNASGNPGLGREVANYLQEQGFGNVYVIQDWPDRQAQTQIIVQQGDLQGAETVEMVLGVGDVIAASTGDLESDLTIRVGSDWAGHTEGL